MKKIWIILIALLAAQGVSAQYYVGNPNWKWETVLAYDAQNKPVYRYMQQCDLNGNVLEQLIQKQALNAWANDTRVTMTYESGRVKDAITALWISGAWVDVQRITPGYDAQFRIISELVDQKISGAWDPRVLREYSYGVGSRKEEMVQKRRSGGQWLIDSKNIYTYDANGYLATILHQYSDNGTDWLDNFRLVYTCNASGYWLEALLESYETGTWSGSNKIIYETDARGNILSETYASLPEKGIEGMHSLTSLTGISTEGMHSLTSLTWKSTEGMKALLSLSGMGNEDIHSFVSFTGKGSDCTDSNSSLTGKGSDCKDSNSSLTGKEWAKGLAKGWVNEFRRIFTYDENDNAITAKTEIASGADWLPTESSSYLYYKNDYLLLISQDHYRCEASYKNFPLGTEEMKEITGKEYNNLIVFPNPVAGSFRVAGVENYPANVEIVTAAGVAVRQFTISSASDMYDIKGLPEGMYIVRVSPFSGKSILTGKLMKSK